MVTKRILFFLLLGSAFVLEGCAAPRLFRSGRSGLLDRGSARGRPFVFLKDPGGTPKPSPTPEEGVRDSRSLEPVRLAAARRKASHWQLPLRQVQVTSRFGRRGQDVHEGIDFRAGVGTPVVAVDSGRVLYADSRIGGYGRMVVLRHESGLATVYAHNSRLFVRKGQWVRRGQTLALSGQSGRSTGPHVHFEVRDGALALDPLAVLPAPTVPRIPPSRTLASRSTRAGRSTRRE